MDFKQVLDLLSFHTANFSSIHARHLTSGMDGMRLTIPLQPQGQVPDQPHVPRSQQETLMPLVARPRPTQSTNSGTHQEHRRATGPHDLYKSAWTESLPLLLRGPGAKTRCKIETSTRGVPHNRQGKSLDEDKLCSGHTKSPQEGLAPRLHSSGMPHGEGGDPDINNINEDINEDTNDEINDDINVDINDDINNDINNDINDLYIINGVSVVPLQIFWLSPKGPCGHVQAVGQPSC